MEIERCPSTLATFCRHLYVECAAQSVERLFSISVDLDSTDSSIIEILFSSFRQVTDDQWDASVVEYTALNITGFRIVDKRRRYVRDFLDGWKRLDPTTSVGAGQDTISVSLIFIAPPPWKRCVCKNTRSD